MQLIAECYDLMQHVLGMSHAQMADTFAQWNAGFLESFLIEITARILRAQDPETKSPMVEVILDKAGQKGTGKWTSEMALRYGIPVPTMHAAVEARCLSARRTNGSPRARCCTAPRSRRRAPRASSMPCATRSTAARSAPTRRASTCSPPPMPTRSGASTSARSRASGRAAASSARASCAASRPPTRQQKQLGKPAARPRTRWLPAAAPGRVAQGRGARRRTRRADAGDGRQPVVLRLVPPRTLPQNLTQAQRDLFGAHTFERTDRPAGEMFHHEWP
jgi:6-phosphogluconate dehydrogenase